MKSYLHIFCAIILFSFCVISCTQESIDGPLGSREDAIAKEGTEQMIKSVTATFEGAFQDTKTILGPGGSAGKFEWIPGDEINIIFGSGYGGDPWYTTITEPSQKAVFNGHLNAATGIEEDQEEDLKFWGFFPYSQSNSVIIQDGQHKASIVIPAEQVAFDYDLAAANNWDLGPYGSWGKDQFPYIAQSDNMLLSFKMLGGGYLFYVSRDDIKEIRFRGDNCEPIAGSCLVTMDNDGIPSVTFDPEQSTSEIILKAPNNGTFKKSVGDTKYYYYLSLPATNFENGFTITAYTDNSCGTRHYSGRSITRKYIGRFTSTPLDNQNMSWGEIPPANNQIFYTTTDGNPVTFHPDGEHHTAGNILSNVYENGKGVITFDDDLTYLDDGAFQVALTLKTVTLPDGLETIGSNAFKEARALTDVHLGSSLATISPYAFAQCESLTSINLPEGLETIGGAAFGLCSSLQSVTLPSSLQSIGVAGVQVINPFYGCRSLASFSGSGSAFSITDDHHFLLTDNGQYLLAVAPGAFGSHIGASCRIPEGIVGIRPYAMVNLIAYSISLPQSLVSIGQGAFIGCDVTLTIAIPSQVTEISFNAFASNDIPRINFGEGDLPAIAENAFGGEGGETYPITMSGYAAVLNSTLLSNNAQWRNYMTAGRVFPLQSNDEIWYHKSDDELIPLSHYDNMNFGSTETPVAATATAFIPSGLPFGVYNAAGQTNSSVPMPFSSTENISIAVVKFDGQVTSVPQNAFANMSTLDYVSLTYGIKTIGLNAFYKTNILKFPLNNSTNLTTIGDQAFYRCSEMSGEINISNVTSLGKTAFNQCDNITKVTLGPITSIPITLFSGCENLKNIVYNGDLTNITSIGRSAFSQCSALTTFDIVSDSGVINFPGVTVLGESAFESCRLTNAVFGAVTSIGERTFNCCYYLQRVTFSSVENLTSVGDLAFNACYALESVGNATVHSEEVVLPEVTSVGSSAFKGCSSIGSFLLGALQTIEASAFEDCTSLVGVILSSVQNLTAIKDKAFLNCPNFKTMFHGGNPNLALGSVTTIGEQAFENSGIMSFMAPNASVIGPSAFKNCTRLTYADIPAVETLRSSLFEGDIALTSVNVTNAKALQDLVFSGCAISTLSLPAIQLIGSHAFEQTSLTTLKLGPELSYLGTYLFSGCTNSGEMNIYFAGGVPRQTEADAFTIIGNSLPYTFNKIYVLQENIQDFENAWQNSYGPYAIWDGVF